MLDKVIKVSIIVVVLIIGFSVLYYFTIYLPSKEQARLEQQARDKKERKFNTINLDLFPGLSQRCLVRSSYCYK